MSQNTLCKKCWSYSGQFHSKSGKIRTRISPNTDNFHAKISSILTAIWPSKQSCNSKQFNEWGPGCSWGYKKQIISFIFYTTVILHYKFYYNNTLNFMKYDKNILWLCKQALPAQAPIWYNPPSRLIHSG